MKYSNSKNPAALRSPRTVLCLALALAGIQADASENYRSRQSPVGAFGGEIAAPADNPGLFGTAVLTSVDIYKVVDSSGNNITVPGLTVPLPTATPTGGAVPNGTYNLNVPAGTIDFRQSQTQLNLMGGYLTESTYADGRLAFAVNVPLIKASRTFVATQAAGTVSPTPGAPLPAPLIGAVNTIGAAANAQVQASIAALTAAQNQDVTGMGDTELSMVWVRHRDRLKVAVGASLFVPTGQYDKTRGPNPGFGNFYTLRPGVAVTYSLNPDHAASSWDSGVTLAGRLSYGINSTNKDTSYRSGNFVYAEGAAIKVSGNWAFGANLLTMRQVTDDTGSGVPADGNRTKYNSIGPFLSYKLLGKDAGFNLQYSHTFGGHYTQVLNAIQLRFIKAW